LAPPAADTTICAGGSSTNLRDITGGTNGKVRHRLHRSRRPRPGDGPRQPHQLSL